MDKNFLLQTETAQELYHNHAAKMPIYDYHCHLSAQEIAEDKQFECMGEAWLAGDHYKWCAMRTNGVTEQFCTGDASYRDKFQKFAEMVPQSIRNPIYHWTHLELQRYFNIDTLLSPETAEEIYSECTAKLQTPEYSARNLMRKMNVALVCTTDDPIDDLRYHKQLQEEKFEVTVLPTFRLDKAMAVDNPEAYNEYVTKLSEITGVKVQSFTELVTALDKRHEFFHTIGGRISDYGVDYMFSEDYTEEEIEAVFSKVIAGETPTELESLKFKSAFLYEVSRMNAKRGWVQQLHIGVFRNNNKRLFAQAGPDIGCDSIADFQQGPSMTKWLNRLDQTNELAKTILYNLNPSDNELFATMIGNFQDGSSAGKMQFGSGWWFLDQKDGMENQMNTLSQLGLLSRFIGMLTDSRSFLSYPRHEYFRSILCNLIGTDVENGEISADMELLGSIVENISFNNAVEYFGIEL